MKFSYFPGCSLKGTGRAYEESFLEVFKVLDIEVEELKQWNCCGATAYMSVNETNAFALAARNLAIAEQSSEDLLAPCSACYLVLNKAEKYLKEYPEQEKKVTEALEATGIDYKGTAKIKHPLEVLVNEVGLDKIKEKVTKPLDGLKVASYYGCQIVRPYALFDDQYNPVTMDNLMETIGATAVRTAVKTKCCGGSLTGTLEDVGLRTVYLLLHDIKRRGVDVIVTLCPLCQFNLEAYQDKLSKKFGEEISIPILHFTQLVGLAMGIPRKKLGLQRQIIPADSIIKERLSAKAAKESKVENQATA